MHVVYVGIHDLDYPRNRRVRGFLRNELSADITTLTVNSARSFAINLLCLVRAGLAPRSGVNVVVLAEFSLQYFIAAWLISKRHRACLVVDHFVGLVETRIEDYADVRPHAMKAYIFRFLDRISARNADIVLVDTVVRATALRSKHRLTDNPVVLPVGAPEWAELQPKAVRSSGCIRLLYYGNYVPLHGIEFVLEAVASLSKLVEVQVTLIGSDSRRRSAERRAEELGISALCKFRPSVVEQALAPVIASHNVVLGVFGTSQKAAGVIANKVWQALACGAMVVTRQSAALRELDPLVPGLIVSCNAGDSPSIAAAILEASAREVSDAVRAGAAQRLDQYVSSGYADLGAVLKTALRRGNRWSIENSAG